MLKIPDIDPVSQAELMTECLKLISHYCPEWTNHNPSDPGITLLELYAWMTEKAVNRLNRIPEKAYLSLLDLIGLSLDPPQAAQVLLSFSPVSGYNGIVRIPRGTEVSTISQNDELPVIFKTVRELMVSSVKLERCVSRRGTKLTDHSDFCTNARSFSLFSGNSAVPRYIYISDPGLESLSTPGTVLHLQFKNSGKLESVKDELITFLEWEFWKGNKWVSMETFHTIGDRKVCENELYLPGPLPIEKREIDGKNGFFIRAKLLSPPEKKRVLEIQFLKVKLLFDGLGVSPDMCLCNTDNMLFTPLDTSKSFTPFIGIPKYNDAFYLASDKGFKKESSRIIINFNLASPESGKEENPDLVLKYEYWNGSSWDVLGSVNWQGDSGEKSYEFKDETKLFTRNGNVSFLRPPDITPLEINGLLHYWIRIRISAGDFGRGGEHVQDQEGNWTWVYDRPVRLPEINSIRIKYMENLSAPDVLLSYYDFHYSDFSETNKKNSLTPRGEKVNGFSIIRITKEKNPAAYLGFDRKFSPGEWGLFFKLDETKNTAPPGYRSFDRIEKDYASSGRSVSLRWEYWNGKKWNHLSVTDETDSFHKSGFIRFSVSEDFSPKEEFDSIQYWFKIILISGSLENDCLVTHILTNSVYGTATEEHCDELLGSSNGAPFQEFELLHKPIISSPVVEVLEKFFPPEEEKESITMEEGNDAIREAEGDGVYIRYHEVNNFYTSRTSSRHYCVDYVNNKILFGDGRNGIIPPGGRNNIIVKTYSTGGGADGNIGAGKIKVLRSGIPYIKEVTNFFPSSGGADEETLEELKARASGVFRNRNRAVTAEDYEWLARQASSSVARARCLEKTGLQGEVIMIILSKEQGEGTLNPSDELLKQVQFFLDQRKLLGTRLKVERPSFRNLSLTIALTFKHIESGGRNQNQLEDTIRDYLHPLKSSRSEEGWPFGMSLSKMDIFNIIMRSNLAGSIEALIMYDEDLKTETEEIFLRDDELLCLNNLTIQEKQ